MARTKWVKSRSKQSNYKKTWISLQIDGKDDIERAQIDAINEGNIALFFKFKQLGIYDFITAAENVPNDQEKKKKFLEETLPKWFGFFERLLKISKSGYFVGDQVSYADLVFYTFLETVISGQEIGFDFFKGYPAIKAHYEKIGNRPNIAKYVRDKSRYPPDVFPVFKK